MTQRNRVPSLVLVALLGAGAASAQITEIIDATGDGTNALDAPRGVAVDGSGNVYVAGEGNDHAFKITPGGTITEIIDATGDGTNVLTNPRGIAVDGSGNVYVAGGLTSNLFRISSGGAVTEIVDGTGDGTNGLNRPDNFSVAVDGSGNVFVSGLNSDNVFRVDASTLATCSTGGTPCTITEIIDATGDGTNVLDGPKGVAVDGSGNVYVTGELSDNAFKIDASTIATCSTAGTPCTITEIIDATGDAAGNTLDLPQGLAADGSGNVFVGGINTDNVFQITSGGAVTEIIDFTGDGAGNNFQNAYGISVDSAGNVYAAAQNTDNAFKIDTPGTCSTGGTPCTITEIIDATGDGTNALDFAYDTAVDSSGNVYVSGFFSDNVFKIAGVAAAVPAASTVGLVVLVLAALVLLAVATRRRAAARQTA